jgi:hypothetical protein
VVTAVEDDPPAHDLDVRREQCLHLRAREDLPTSWHGQSSPLLTLEHDT